MKINIIIVLFLCFNSSIILAADEEEPMAPKVEFFFRAINTTQAITFSAVSMSLVYDTYTSGVYPITTSYSSSQYTYKYDSTQAGWHFVDSQDLPGYPVLAFGLYKFYYNGNFFYLDLRDQRFGVDSIYTQNDIWFTFDFNTGLFSYSNYGFGDLYPISIDNGEYLTVWGIKDKGCPSFAGFQNYSWNSCLSINNGIHPTDGFPNPFVIWGPNPDFNTTGYNVYRKIYPAEQQFSLIAQTCNTQLVYNDYSLVSAGNNTIAYYKIKAYNNENESAFSNESWIYVDTNPAKKGFEVIESTRNVNTSIKVNQNYPNPFNPTTEIRYSLLEERKVKIIISNILGQNITTLIDDHQNKGDYSFSFNAEGLPSGIYYCFITSGEYFETIKMIYLQ